MSSWFTSLGTLYHGLQGRLKLGGLNPAEGDDEAVTLGQIENLLGSSTEGEISVNTISEREADTGVTVDGALVKDGSFIGKSATATATADGLDTGLLTGADQFVAVTSANADHIIALPITTSIPVGTVIRGYVGANGCELRANATETLTVNGVTSTEADVEAAIPANCYFEAKLVAALTWMLTTHTGTTLAAPTPDAIA